MPERAIVTELDPIIDRLHLLESVKAEAVAPIESSATMLGHLAVAGPQQS